MNDYHQYLSLGEAAEYLGTSAKVLSSLMRRRLVPYIRISRKTIRFKRSRLDEAMQRLESGVLYED